MKVIYKYPLSNPFTRLDLPWGAQVLTAQMQGDQIVLWALIEQDEVRMVPRSFAAVNTGASFEISDSLKYINTVTSGNGIVWHVFEVNL